MAQCFASAQRKELSGQNFIHSRTSGMMGNEDILRWRKLVERVTRRPILKITTGSSLNRKETVKEGTLGYQREHGQ